MAKELNLPYHCFTHFLRKTFAYWFLQIHKNDMSALATLQEILNHCSEKMTLKYCGIEKESKEAIMNPVEFGKSCFSRHTYKNKRCYKFKFFNIVNKGSYNHNYRDNNIFIRPSNIVTYCNCSLGPSDRSRTCGLLNPIQARYQTAPHPEFSNNYYTIA